MMFKLLDETKLRNSFSRVKHEIGNVSYKTDYFQKVNENLRKYLHTVESRLRKLETSSMAGVVREVRDQLKVFEIDILKVMENIKIELSEIQVQQNNNQNIDINPLIDRIAALEEKLVVHEQEHSIKGDYDSRYEIASLAERFDNVVNEINPLKQQMESVDQTAMLEMFHNLNGKINALQKEISNLKVNSSQEVVVQFDKNKRDTIKEKILGIIKENELSVPQLKVVVVDKNNLCSKASFYRYVKDLLARNVVEEVKIGDTKVVVFKP